MAALCYGQASYTVMTDLMYNEGFGMRSSNGAAGWKGWSILGSTDLPYELGMGDYPDDTADNAVQRLILDLQDRGETYPRLYSGVADTGRVLRIQVQDGGAAFDLTSYKVYVYSFKQSDDTAIRTKADLSAYVTYATGGWIEWPLDPTLDTAASMYFYLDLELAGHNLDVPTDNYVYVDVEEKGKVTYVSGVVMPTIKIRPGTWYGKSVNFAFHDAEGNAIDLSQQTVQMNYEDQGKTPAYINSAACTTGGVCTFSIPTGKFSGAAGTIYPICFKITADGTGAEFILEPARGHIILEVF